MDLAMMLSDGRAADDAPAEERVPKRARDAQGDDVIAAASSAMAASPYADLQRAVHNALESKAAALTTSDKVALALEVLRARQLELDLAQARSNIEALVTKTGSAPRTLRAVIPASTVKGLPVGTPIEIAAGKFLLSPTTNDPQALFLTLELQNFGAVASDTQNLQSTAGPSSVPQGDRDVHPNGADPQPTPDVPVPAAAVPTAPSAGVQHTGPDSPPPQKGESAAQQDDRQEQTHD